MPEMCNGPDAGSNRDCRGAKAMHKCSCSRIRPGLFLGCKCCEQCPSMIKQLGVTHVLQVGTDLQPSHLSLCTYCTLPIEDSADADIIACLPRALAFIHSSLQSGSRVLVHCHAGLSRSATVLAAYLMWAEGLSSGAALSEVRRVRPCINPNVGFQQQLHHFELLGCDAATWPGWQVVRAATLAQELGPAAAAAGIGSFEGVQGLGETPLCDTVSGWEASSNWWGGPELAH